MRLICPNCGAQYEVAEDAIPAAGRDVQCSNCAHTWFETPGASEAREAGEAATPPVAPVPDPAPVAEQPDMESTTADTVSAPTDTTDATGPSTETESSAEVETEADSGPETDAETDAGQDDLSEPSADTADSDMPQRRPLSPSVADILREEAAREEAKRTADAETGIESQPDLGLDRPMDRDEQLAEEARRRMARLKGEAAPAIGAATAVAAGARGEMLPDIEEINSSLRSETDRAETAPAAEKAKEVKRKSGFRRGFLTVIILALIALLIYIFAPQISAAVPALEPALTSYVETVNQARLWLDLQLQNLLPGGEE